MPQDDSRPWLHPFVVETKPYIKPKGGSLRMMAFLLAFTLASVHLLMIGI